jgi:CRISPR-associated protein Cmr3
MSKSNKKSQASFSNNYKNNQKSELLTQSNKASKVKRIDEIPDPNGALWCFSAVDTWFFRESRPMESIGGAQLQSVFPPPARTLIGAIRTAIGQAHGVNWHNYPHEREHQTLHQWIGDGQHLGRLSFQGPMVWQGGERLYPAPLVLLQSGEDFTRLAPSQAVTDCDLGKVQLPKKQSPELQGAKPLEGAWLTEAGFAAVLKGGHPSKQQVVKADALFHKEERLGIGRNNATRTTGDGLLYQTEHVRPQQDVTIGMCVQGLQASDDDGLHVPASGMARLGAEGRLAHWQRQRPRPAVSAPASASSGKCLLVLVTHARFNQGWLPDGFEKTTTPKTTTSDGQTVWEGVLHGVRLRLLCAVVGKPVREGGWDVATRRPRAVESLTPAGSCYFCEVIEGQAQTLHGSHIGQDTAYGRGELAVGVWH